MPSLSWRYSLYADVSPKYENAETENPLIEIFQLLE
jgi:hypothetical protein